MKSFDELAEKIAEADRRSGRAFIEAVERDIYSARPPQPGLVDVFGVQFYGRAETTGDIWWYEKDGKRYPLCPVEPQACANPVEAK